MTRFRTLALGVLLTAVLGLPTVAVRAQTSGDDAIEKLLRDLEDQSKPAGEADQPGQVADEDRSLDSLLEKLGGGSDEPSPDGRPPKPGAGGEEGPTPPDAEGQDEAAGGEKPTQPDALEGRDKTLDEHLEEILGRRKNDKDDQGGDPAGPLAEAIKKMEEVRKRLADTDTGDETRQKQGEVVSELERLLEQLRQAEGQGSSQGQRTSRRTQQAGQQPGQQPGGDPSNPNGDGRGTGPSMPQRPGGEEALVNRKDIWGDLPPTLREEMDNIFKEEMLEAKRELIQRYFDSVAEKGQSRGPQ